MSEQKKAPPISIVIFGGSGDLAIRKLLPALYELFNANLLNDFKIVSYGRTMFSTESYKELLSTKLQSSPKLDHFLAQVSYFQGDYENRADFEKLEKQLDRSMSTTLFYLALPPNLVLFVAENIKATMKHTNYRLIFEKPFGVDHSSAQKLDQRLKSLFDEEQIYRIDHYLGKETVQNILAFRFANNIFEPLWNNRYISHIELNIGEELGVGNRGPYFDDAGIVRDLIQNHVLQLLALVTMEAPNSFSSTSIRDEKVKLLESLHLGPCLETVALRGQYKGYLSERGVSPNSKTETFAALKIEVRNWRFGGTPIFIRAGKALAQKQTEVHIHFKEVPMRLFQTPSGDLGHNTLIFRIQPHEGIHLLFQTKKPGANFALTPMEMDFNYQDNFKSNILEAYSRLLIDAMTGDSSLFIRGDEVLASWKLIDPLLQYWKEKESLPLYLYEQGQAGPEEMHSFISNLGYTWSQDFCRLKNSPKHSQAKSLT